jgi:FkbM family methyltransferase
MFFQSRGYRTALAEKLYTVFLRPKYVRAVVNWLLLRIIRRQVRILDQFDLLLNPKDPVLSGALTLGVYEPFEQAVFLRMCQPGFRILDIGANIGLYTGIAASRVGPEGLVLSIEPHPEAFSFLNQTCQLNHFTNVRTFNVAAGDSYREVSLFVTDDNKGDSRIFDANGTRSHIKTQMVPLDSLLREQKIEQVDIIKMDIQGAEGLALAGLRTTLKCSTSLAVFTEYWPWGLLQTGADPLAFLKTFADLGFAVSVIDELGGQVLKVKDLSGFVSDFRVTEYTSVKMQRSHVNLLFTKG